MDNWEKLVVRVWDGPPNQGGRYRGSAFFVSSRHLLTARHVIENLDWTKIRLDDGPWGQGLFGLDKCPSVHAPREKNERDIAILTVARPVEGINGIDLDFGDPKVGEKIILGGLSTETGQLEIPELPIGSYDGEIDAYVAHTFVGTGMSGGPALRNGRLVGVIQARDKESNKTYIIPISAFKEFLGEFIKVNYSERRKGAPQDSIFKTELANTTAMLVDKEDQVKHIFNLSPLSQENPTAFIFASAQQHWPEAASYRLAFELSPSTERFSPPVKLLLRPTDLVISGHTGKALTKSLLSACQTVDKWELENILSRRETPQVFYLKSYTVSHFSAIQVKELVQSWEQDIFGNMGPRPYLIIVVEEAENISDEQAKKSGLFQRLFRWNKTEPESFVNRYKSDLQKVGLGSRVLPGPVSPTKDHVNEWVDNCVPTDLDWMPDRETLKRKAFKLFENSQPSIPHYPLGEKLVNLLMSADR